MKMNKRVLMGVGVGMVIAAAGFFYWYQAAFASIGNLQVYAGSADVIEGSETRHAETGMPVKLNDAFTVFPGSRVAIVLKDGSRVRLEAGTRMEILQLEFDHGRIARALFKVDSGKVWSFVEPLAPSGSFQVETPTIVASVRGTSFDVIYEKKLNVVYVSKRVVDANLASDPQHVKTIHEHQILRIHDDSAAADFAAGPTDAGPGDVDDWVIFNEGEDAALAKESGHSLLEKTFLPSVPTISPRNNTADQTPSSMGEKPTPSPIRVPVVSISPSFSPSLSPSPSSRATPLPSVIATNTPSPTPMLSPSETPSPTPTPVPTPTPTPLYLSFIARERSINDPNIALSWSTDTQSVVFYDLWVSENAMGGSVTGKWTQILQPSSTVMSYTFTARQDNRTYKFRLNACDKTQHCETQYVPQDYTYAY